MLFNNRLGNWIDNVLMNITAKRWQKKVQQKKLNTRGIIMCLDTGKHYAKPDPKNFQEKILSRYENKISMLTREPQNSLAH